MTIDPKASSFPRPFLPVWRWPRYGVDAAPFPAGLGAAGLACSLAAARWRHGWRHGEPAVTFAAAARRLPEGRAVGVDLWTADQSGNRPGATLANAAAAGVADRVDVRTGDMTALPFGDNSFDVVTSALAIHNIHSAEGRHRAIEEAMRVLRPGGQLVIADIGPMARKYAEQIGHGTLRPLGPEYWYGGPWFGVTLLHAIKER